jgi:hypothetical protein
MLMVSSSMVQTIINFSAILPSMAAGGLVIRSASKSLHTCRACA